MTNEREVRMKFWDAARKQFPDAVEPGACWVLTEVLGWPWAKLVTVPVEGFSRKGYRTFRYNADGTKMRGEDGMSVKTVYREWTKAEKAKLKDWWWLLGY